MDVSGFGLSQRRSSSSASALSASRSSSSRGPSLSSGGNLANDVMLSVSGSAAGLSSFGPSSSASASRMSRLGATMISSTSTYTTSHKSALPSHSISSSSKPPSQRAVSGSKLLATADAGAILSLVESMPLKPVASTASLLSKSLSFQPQIVSNASRQGSAPNALPPRSRGSNSVSSVSSSNSSAITTSEQQRWAQASSAPDMMSHYDPLVPQISDDVNQNEELDDDDDTVPANHIPGQFVLAPGMSLDDDGPKQQSSSSSASLPLRKPTRMQRAKTWSPEVEQVFRLSECGWQSLEEYISAYGEPERWASNHWLRTLRIKTNGYFTYWDETRQCPDNLLNRVKLYYYD